MTLANWSKSMTWNMEHICAKGLELEQHLFHFPGLRSTKWYLNLLRFMKIFSSFYSRHTVEFLMCDDDLEAIE